MEEIKSDKRLMEIIEFEEYMFEKLKTISGIPFNYFGKKEEKDD